MPGAHALPKGDAARKRAKVVVEPNPPRIHRSLGPALRESIKAASWLRETDSAAIELLRRTLLTIEAQPDQAHRYIPLAMTQMTTLGLSPEARVRLAVEQVDRKPKEPKGIDYAKPTLLAKAE